MSTSFAAEVKNELARQGYGDDECRRAELAGLLRLGASFVLGGGDRLGLRFSTGNAAVGRKALAALRALGADVALEVSRSQRLRRAYKYTLEMAPTAAHGAMLSRLKVKAFVPEGSAERLAYLRGAFLAMGSVNRPTAPSHFELLAENYEVATLLVELLRRCNLPAKLTDRKRRWVVYIKDGEAITDLLAMWNATEAVRAFEVARNVKEVRAQVNRRVNCETANINKTATASARQCAAVRSLMNSDKWPRLSRALREMAQLRLERPDATLNELSEAMRIGRAGVNYRLRTLVALAESTATATKRNGDD